MSAHFNIALYPQSADFARSVVDLAQANLAGKTDSYLIGDRAHPHLTLCQFQCSPDLIKEVWKGFLDVCAVLVPVSFSHIYIKAGTGPLHQGKNWVGLCALPAISLITLQKSVYEKLGSMGIESPTNPLNYFPHLTLGRLDQAQPITIIRVPDNTFWLDPYVFNFSLGRSDEVGVYSERLF